MSGDAVHKSVAANGVAVGLNCNEMLFNPCLCILILE